jgi:hypothetical protein
LIGREMDRCRQAEVVSECSCAFAVVYISAGNSTPDTCMFVPHFS